MNHYTHPQHHHHSTIQMMMDSGGGGCTELGNNGNNTGVVVGNTNVGNGTANNALQSQLMGMNNTGQSGGVGLGITMSVNPINGSYHAHPSAASAAQTATQTLSFEHSSTVGGSGAGATSGGVGGGSTGPQQFDSSTQAYTMYLQYHPSDAGSDLSQQYSDHSWSNKHQTGMQAQQQQQQQIVNQYDQSWNNSWSQQQQQQQQPQTQAQYQQQHHQLQANPQATMFTSPIDQLSYHPEMIMSQQQQPSSAQQNTLTPSTINDVVHQTSNPTTTAATTTTNKKPASKRKKAETGTKESKIPTAYALFFRNTQPEIKQENPRLPFGDISKIVSERWQKLGEDEKEQYKQKANYEKKNLRLNAASTKAKQLAANQDLSGSQQIIQQQQQHSQQQQSQAPSHIAQRATATTAQLQSQHQHDSTTIQFLNQYQPPGQIQANQFIDHQQQQHSQMSNFAQDSLYLGSLTDSFTNDSQSLTNHQYLTTGQPSAQQQPQQQPPQQQSTCLDYNQDSNSIHSNPHDSLSYDPLSLIDFDEDNFANFNFTSSDAFDSNDFMDELAGIPSAVFDDHSLLAMNDELSGESFLSSGLGVSTPTGTLGISDDSQLSNQATVIGHHSEHVVPFSQGDQALDQPRQQQQAHHHQQQHPPTSQHLVQQSQINNNITQTDHLKPSENGSSTLSISQRYCTRNGCNAPAIDCKTWSAPFCSEQCCMKHCEDVFNRWRKDRAAAVSAPSTNNSGLKTTSNKVDGINSGTGVNSNNPPTGAATNLNLVVS